MTPDKIAIVIILIGGLIVYVRYLLTEGDTPDLPDRWNK